MRKGKRKILGTFRSRRLTALDVSNYIDGMEAELKEILATLADEFANATGRKPGGIWAEAAKDGRFMDRVESGQTFTVKVFDRAVQWFSDNWPDGVRWPKVIKRPAVSVKDGTAA